MPNKTAMASVKTQLSTIAEHLAQKNGSYSTGEVYEEFEKKFKDLEDSEKHALMSVGTRVLCGRLSSAKSKIKWKSPFLAELGLTETIRLRLPEGKKYITRSYPVKDVTPKMISLHDEGLKKKKNKSGNNFSNLDRIREAIYKMKEDGFSENTTLFEYAEM